MRASCWKAESPHCIIIANKDTFYFSTVTLDWTDPQNVSLWQDAVKTLFDPCPAGWRVPKSGAANLSPWNSFGDTDQTYVHGEWIAAATGLKGGRWYSPAVYGGQAWYPGNGCRLPATGIFVVVDEVGHAWSSTLIGTQASFLRLWDPEMSPRFPIPRGYAFSVRCIRE